MHFFFLLHSLITFLRPSSVLGGRQQLLHRGSSGVKPVLPAILLEHHARRFLRADRYGPQERIQAPEYGPREAVPTRTNRSHRSSIVRSLSSARPEHVQLDVLAGVHCYFTQKRFPAPATVSLLALYLPTNFQLFFFFSPRIQITAFVRNLAEYHSDINKFKLSLRDFLVQLKEFAGDNAELYLEEKEAEAQMKAQEERETAMKIPGMLKPSQIQDQDEEL